MRWASAGSGGAQAKGGGVSPGLKNASNDGRCPDAILFAFANKSDHIFVVSVMMRWLAACRRQNPGNATVPENRQALVEVRNV